MHLTAGVRDDSRREHVINAACEVFARYGYQKASMQDIARAAGVSKSVLFKYFETKDNLYRIVFRIASDGIYRADAQARAQGYDSDVFCAMRRMASARMCLFSRLPWVYSFSYTAAYDSDPFVQSLVREEYARRGIGSDPSPAYRGIRQDIPNEAAKKLIRWVLEGFLEEKLKTGDTEPEKLKREFDGWIDLMELLLKEEGK